MRLDARELVAFCDSDPDAARYSSGIKALALEEVSLVLLERYFSEQGLNPKAYGPCTAEEGGHRLDGWISVLENGLPVHYQIEVKSWSFHGYGEDKKNPVDPFYPAEKLAEFMRKKFGDYWDSETRRFQPKMERLKKVLLPMRNEEKGEKRPLACLWTPIHDKGEIDQPLFTVNDVDDPHFKTLWIFSVSAYLRQHLRTKKSSIIELELPKTREALSYLQRIFPAG